METSERKNDRLVIGVGNEFRHDDSCGLYIANRLKEISLPYTDIVILSGESTTLIESWKGYSVVYIIDAVLSPEEPGTIFRINALEQEIPKSLFKYSIHSFGIAEAIEIGKMISNLPEKLIIYGIVPESLHIGKGLSNKVLKSSKEIIKSISDEIINVHSHEEKGN